MKIVSLEENDKLSINDGQVIEILKKAQALPLSVLVITGQGRMGKSFLLNFIRQYCSTSWKTAQEWMRDIDQGSCFEFSSGYEAVTNGLVMWSEPLILNIQGKQTALLLIDCQGLFDDKTTRQGNRILCTLSSLLSSLLLLNVRSPFNESHLEYFKTSFEYSRAMIDEKMTNAFQDLIIVHRDCTLVESPNGWSGGQSWQEDFFHSQGNYQHKVNREDLLKCFPHVTSFTFSSPPSVVCRSSFEGKIGVLDDSDQGRLFKESIQNFVTHLHEHLKIKVTEGTTGQEDMTGPSFYRLLTRIIEIVNERADFDARALKESLDLGRMMDRLDQLYVNLIMELNDNESMLCQKAKRMKPQDLLQELENMFLTTKDKFTSLLESEPLLSRIPSIEYNGGQGSPREIFDHLLNERYQETRQRILLIEQSLRVIEKREARIIFEEQEFEKRRRDIETENEKRMQELEQQIRDSQLEFERRMQDMQEDREQIEREVKESERRHKLMQYELQQQAESQVKEAIAAKEAMARELEQLRQDYSRRSREADERLRQEQESMRAQRDQGYQQPSALSSIFGFVLGLGRVAAQVFLAKTSKACCRTK